MTNTRKNVIVVGASYVGLNTANELVKVLPAETHRVILIDKHSHFHHLFAFPVSHSREQPMKAWTLCCTPRPPSTKIFSPKPSAGIHGIRSKILTRFSPAHSGSRLLHRTSTRPSFRSGSRNRTFTCPRRPFRPSLRLMSSSRAKYN